MVHPTYVKYSKASIIYTSIIRGPRLSAVFETPIYYAQVLRIILIEVWLYVVKIELRCKMNARAAITVQRDIKQKLIRSTETVQERQEVAKYYVKLRVQVVHRTRVQVVYNYKYIKYHRDYVFSASFQATLSTETILNSLLLWMLPHNYRDNTVR